MPHGRPPTFTFAQTPFASIAKKSIMTETDPLTRLRILYHQTSKHSNYQVLAPVIRDLVGDMQIDVQSRFEDERMSFIEKNVVFRDKAVFDIGGNTGYFSFQALKFGSQHVHYFEGNAAHSQFVGCARDTVGLKDQMSVHNSYCDFQHDQLPKCDIGIVLNVLHHVGDDFGDGKMEIATAKEQMITKLNWLSGFARTLVFQVGFCWKGDRNLLLFENGTKTEMIDFIKEGITDHWKISAIGIAEKETSGIVYRPPSEQNLKRDESLGEFLNRPLFILSSSDSAN